MANVEEVLALDIRALRRLGALQAGERIIDTVRWSQSGLRCVSVRLRSDLSAVEHGGVIAIDGTMPDGPIRQDIAIEQVPAGFEGWRCYFICPVTAERCEVLYYAAGRFASRRAHRLSYMSQNLTDLSRARRKVAKLTARLEGKAGSRRPRGGNRQAIIGRLDDASRDARALYLEKLRSHFERSGTQL